MQNLFLIPKGTRFFLISAEPSIELCLNNDIVDSLTFKLPPKSLIGLAINTPLSVNSADSFVNAVEDNVQDIINILPEKNHPLSGSGGADGGGSSLPVAAFPCVPAYDEWRRCLRY